MAWQFGLNVYLMLAAAAISFAVVVVTLRRRRTPASLPLAAVTLAGGLWALMSGLEIASGSLGGAILIHKFAFLAMGAIGVAWWAFAVTYAGRERWASRKVLIVLSILPLVTQLLVWTNAYHGLMFESLQMTARGGHLYLHKGPGIWWWIDSAYTYGLLLAGFLVLFRLLLREFGLYRRQVVALCVALIVPLVADILYIANTPGGETVDWAPAFFAWVGIVLYWGFTRYRLLDLTPVAREFVAEHLSDALIVTDNEDRATYMNLAGEKLLGVNLNTIVGKPLQEALTGFPGLSDLYDRARNSVRGGLQEWQHSGRYYDGRVSAMCDGSGRVRGSILVLRDTTDRKMAEFALDDARQDLEERVVERTVELASEKERLARLNTVAVQVARCGASAEVVATGVHLACEAVGATAGTLWLRSRKGPMKLLHHDSLSEESWQTLQFMFSTSIEVEMALNDALPICLGAEQIYAENTVQTSTATDAASNHLPPSPGFRRVAVVPLISRGVNLGALCLVSSNPAFARNPDTLPLAGAVASHIAVALENVRRYEDVQFLAERDSLTGLLNHRGFSRRFEQEAVRSMRSGSVLGLVMIDVDNFKLFNDAHGHVVGDQVLQEVARILTAALRRSDIIARYGGDEFIAALPDTDAEAAVQLVERVRVALRESPFVVGGHNAIPLQMSYGIAVLPNDGNTAADLLAAADANLYRSKRRGGDFITASGGDSSHWPVAVGSFSVLDGLVTMVDKRDNYTRRHSEDVTEYALLLASRMELSVDTQRALRVAGLLHDVGKLGVPDHVLRKPADLSDAEFEAIRNHVTLAELIIQGIPNQEEVLSAVSSHHERFDGKGYPRGLKGAEIPLLGRILAVTDAYSAMTTDRPYRKALSPASARAELEQVAGTQLDPQLVEIFLMALEDEERRDETRVAVFASAAG